MNFSEEVKSEIIGIEYDSSCCKHAVLSAFIRSAGSIGTRGGQVGFEVATDNPLYADYFSLLLNELYGIKPNSSSGEDKLNRKGRISLDCINKSSLDILIDLGIVEVDSQGVAVKLNIDQYIVENECCKIAYIRGAFLGSGSVTLPRVDGASSTGYHLEFIFTNYQTATDFCEILSEVYFLPKLIERKGNFIVYLKTRDEISDILTMMGATNSALKLYGLAVEKDMNNNTNRKINCEVSNMSKQIGASVKLIRAINKIDETIGLDSLPQTLVVVAKARIENKVSTMGELASILGITKSCLNHRLRKISEIAETL